LGADGSFGARGILKTGVWKTGRVRMGSPRERPRTAPTQFRVGIGPGGIRTTSRTASPPAGSQDWSELGTPQVICANKMALERDPRRTGQARCSREFPCLWGPRRVHTLRAR
jgi:hypothetical protein